MCAYTPRPPRKDNKAGWAPKPLVFQLFFAGFRSFKRAGLAGLAELGFAGPVSQPAIQPASKTIRNLKKKLYFYEKIQKNFKQL